MAPINLEPGWSHPRWYGVEAFYADGGDDAEPAEGGDAATEDAEPGDDWTPPSREEWEAHQEKLRTASGEAASRRKYLRAHGIDPKTGQKIDAGEPAEPAADASKPAGDQTPNGASPEEVQKAVQRAVAEAKVEGLRAAKTMVSNVNSVLDDIGWNGQRLSLVMQLANLDGLDADDKEGIQEEFERVKEVFPEGFTPVRRRSNPSSPAAGSGQNGAPAAKVDVADKPAPKPEPKTWAEQLAAKALRG